MLDVFGTARLHHEFDLRALDRERAEGALVAEPQANGPAAKAGIQSGDVITAVNGEPVKEAKELARTIGGVPALSTRCDCGEHTGRRTNRRGLAQVRRVRPMA